LQDIDRVFEGSSRFEEIELCSARRNQNPFISTPGTAETIF